MKLRKQSYQFEILVRANSQQEAAETMRSELDIRDKTLSQYRPIDQYYLFTTELGVEIINKDFYQKIYSSNKIAILNDEVSEELREPILAGVSKTENELRKLLTHISDTVDNFYKILPGERVKKIVDENESLINADSLNPIISELSLEQMLEFLGQDMSWKGRAVEADGLQKIVDNSDNYAEFKEKLNSKMERFTPWEAMSSTIIKNGSSVSWKDLKKEIESLTKIRNNAAHFKTLRISDYYKAKSLTENILGKIQVKQRISKSQFEELQKAIRPLNESLVDALTKASLINSKVIEDAIRLRLNVSGPLSESLGALRDTIARDLLSNPYFENDKSEDISNDDVSSNKDNEEDDSDEGVV